MCHVARLPVRDVISASHFPTDLTLTLCPSGVRLFEGGLSDWPAMHRVAPAPREIALCEAVLNRSGLDRLFFTTPLDRGCNRSTMAVLHSFER